MSGLSFACENMNAGGIEPDYTRSRWHFYKRCKIRFKNKYLVEEVTWHGKWRKIGIRFYPLYRSWLQNDRLYFIDAANHDYFSETSLAGGFSQLRIFLVDGRHWRNPTPGEHADPHGRARVAEHCAAKRCIWFLRICWFLKPGLKSAFTLKQSDG